MNKRVLLEILAFIQYKVENDLLTMDEIDSIVKSMEANLVLVGTLDDLADFYGQTKTNVTSVIKRRMIEKPTRRVYYSFNAFRKIVPERWRSQSKKTSREPGAAEE